MTLLSTEDREQIDNSSIHQLYTQLGNKKMQPVRMACQDRIQGRMRFKTTHALHRSIAYLEYAIDRFPEGEARQTAFEVIDVLRYMADNPDMVHAKIDKAYNQEYLPDTKSDGPRREGSKCPYEQEGHGKACWKCYVPKKVYQECKAEFRHEQAKEEAGLK